jgi:RimJ/RimL family protein N-acetyltransferase
MSMDCFEPLATQRLVLRRLAPDDAEAFFAYKSLPECVRYQFWRPATLEETRQRIRDMEGVRPNEPGQWLQLAICLKDTGALVGDIGMHFSADDDAQAEIGYTLDPARWGRGYATEAARAVVGYLFGMLKKHRVTASADPRNGSSLAVLERLGFRREAHFPKSILMHGEWCDDVVYAMLREEWEAKNRAEDSSSAL